MTQCSCAAGNPLRDLGYLDSARRGVELCAQGWRQRKCDSCDRYTVWVREGSP